MNRACTGAFCTNEVAVLLRELILSLSCLALQQQYSCGIFEMACNTGSGWSLAQSLC
jgi:hypothetical protein